MRQESEKAHNSQDFSIALLKWGVNATGCHPKRWDLGWEAAEQDGKVLFYFRCFQRSCCGEPQNYSILLSFVSKAHTHQSVQGGRKTQRDSWQSVKGVEGWHVFRNWSEGLLFKLLFDVKSQCNLKVRVDWSLISFELWIGQSQLSGCVVVYHQSFRTVQVMWFSGQLQICDHGVFWNVSMGSRYYISTGMYITVERPEFEGTHKDHWACVPIDI